jgi:prevent-host-death family protein
VEVSVRELKNNLSRFLRMVSRGDTLTIVSRKRPVARIVPHKAADKGDPTRDVAEILRSLPWIKAQKGKPSGLARRVVLRPGSETASDVVISGR